MKRLSVIMLACCAAMAGATTASVPPAAALPAATTASTLSALTAADLRIIDQKSDKLAATGAMSATCTCSFQQGAKTFVRVVGKELFVRTLAGLQTCGMSGATAEALRTGKQGTMMCSGSTITFKAVGKPYTAPDKTHDVVPTLMTMSAGGRTASIRGTFFCIC